MTDKPIKVFIAVGSNIDPEINILQALKRIKEPVKITGISTFYQTPPIERPVQQPFLNGVWRIETLMSARTLKFNCLRTIENELGRVRTEDKYAARTIDLDIIIYGDMVIDEPDLQIPDPDIYTRSF
ncbi:MAG: 2-amino-4-hydroxy-6-hydroxymethyldihydropteridine diphosphokinase, partial [Planctomycetota bacterium]